MLLLKVFDLFLCCINDCVLIVIVLIFVELRIVKLLPLDYLLYSTWDIGLSLLSSWPLEVFGRILIADLLLLGLILVVVEEACWGVVVIIIIILGLSLIHSFS